MLSNLKKFLILGCASALTSSGSLLIVLSLAIDVWREGTFNDGNNVTITYHQGILNECVYNGTLPKHCYDWTKSAFVKDLFEYQQLLFYFVAASAVMGSMSLLLSIAATTSRIAKLVIPVTAFELAAALIGFVSLIIYTAKYINKPWSPSFSYFAVWAGTLFITIGLVLHSFVGDVKFFGRKFFVEPKPDYHYHKGNNTLIQVGFM